LQYFQITTGVLFQKFEKVTKIIAKLKYGTIFENNLIIFVKVCTVTKALVCIGIGFGIWNSDCPETRKTETTKNETVLYCPGAAASNSIFPFATIVANESGQNWPFAPSQSLYLLTSLTTTKLTKFMVSKLTQPIIFA
jgi:hypothetical protein